MVTMASCLVHSTHFGTLWFETRQQLAAFHDASRCDHIYHCRFVLVLRAVQSNLSRCHVQNISNDEERNRVHLQMHAFIVSTRLIRFEAPNGFVHASNMPTSCVIREDGDHSIQLVCRAEAALL
jgi:hypothetical protein